VTVTSLLGIRADTDVKMASVLERAIARAA
jgi:hypothetical protein